MNTPFVVSAISRPVTVSEERWSQLSEHEQLCGMLLAEEDAVRNGRLRDVWPLDWTDDEIRQARIVGRRVLDPRIGRR